MEQINRPWVEVEIEGMAAESINESEGYKRQNLVNCSFHGADLIDLADGRIVVAWLKNATDSSGEIWVSECDSIAEVLGNSNLAENSGRAVKLFDLQGVITTRRCPVNLFYCNGNAFMIVLESGSKNGNPFKTNYEIYKMGDNYKSWDLVWSVEKAWGVFGNNPSYQLQGVRSVAVEGNNILIGLDRPQSGGSIWGGTDSKVSVIESNDGGISWSETVFDDDPLKEAGDPNGKACHCLVFPDGRKYVVEHYNALYSNLVVYESINESWLYKNVTIDKRWGQIGNQIFDTQAFCVVGEYVYCYHGWDGKLKQRKCSEITADNFLNYDLWENINVPAPQLATMGEATVLKSLKNINKIALLNAYNQRIITIWELDARKLNVANLNINKSEGIADSCTFELDNKDGIWSFDGPNTWVVGPNKKITVKHGYQDSNEKCFLGLIDGTVASSHPQMLNVTCRSMMKKALDQTIRKADGSRTLTYKNMTVEAIFTHLAGLMGYEGTSLVTEAAGVIISEKTFSWESYADAFNWLCDIAGFSWRIDNDDILHFEKLKNVLEIAHVFEEGVNIESIMYEVDDSDLYYEIAVFGQKDEDTTISASWRMDSTVNRFNVLPGKVMKVDIEGIVTQEYLQQIANNMAVNMLNRARKVSITAPMVPHLDIGMCVQIIESSSTISEAYRVTDLTFNHEPGKATMSLSGYHFGYVE